MLQVPDTSIEIICKNNQYNLVINTPALKTNFSMFETTYDEEKEHYVGGLTDHTYDVISKDEFLRDGKPALDAAERALSKAVAKLGD